MPLQEYFSSDFHSNMVHQYTVFEPCQLARSLSHIFYAPLMVSQWEAKVFLFNVKRGVFTFTVNFFDVPPVQFS